MADDAEAAAERRRDEDDRRSLALIEAGKLPLRAQERLARMKGRAFTSALSVPAFATTHGVGFDPVGQVLGTCVYQLGWSYNGCGYWGYQSPGTGFGGYAGGGFSGAGLGGGGFAGISVVDVTTRRHALREATARALSRLTAEARGLAADGVVDVRLTWSGFPGVNGAIEVEAIGTAVRGRGENLRHLPTPFLSDLSGQDVSLLLRGGYAPTGVAVGIAVCVRHDDYWTRQSSTTWAGNIEIGGVTELVTETRHRARVAAAADVASLGGTALVVRAMSLRTWEQEPSDGHRDHLAEASVVGTSVVPLSTGSAARPRTDTLSILRLNGPRTTDPRRQAL